VRDAIEPKAVRPRRHRGARRRAYRSERKDGIEEAQKRSDGAARVIVLGIRQKQRQAAFQVAKIDVVGGADDAAVGGDRNLCLRLRPQSMLLFSAFNVVDHRRARRGKSQ
jgi:hypothetical protein